MLTDPLRRWLLDETTRMEALTLALSCNPDEDTARLVPKHIDDSPLRIEFAPLQRDELRTLIDRRFAPNEIRRPSNYGPMLSSRNPYGVRGYSPCVQPLRIGETMTYDSMTCRPRIPEPLALAILTSLAGLGGCMQEDLQQTRPGPPSIELIVPGGPDDAYLEGGPVELIASIETETGEPVYSAQPVTLIPNEDELVAERLQLDPGTYRLTQLQVTNDIGETLYNVPAETDEGAASVDTPLPIPFVVADDATTILRVDVLRAEPTKPTTAEPKSQCGSTADFQHVEAYDGTLGVSQDFVATHQRPVGKHNRGCSGTLISRNLFLSAGHCPYEVGDTVTFDYQRLGATIIVKWGETFAVTEVIEQQWDGNYDYAIVRLAGTPGNKYGVTPMRPTTPSNGENVIVIGHPNGEPKQVSAGPKVSGSSLGSNWFRHRADTFGGSSGSGVLNRYGQLLGVHTDSGCSTGTDTSNGNHAMRMYKLMGHSSTLAALRPRRLRPQHSNKCLDVKSNSTNNGANVQQYTCKSSKNTDQNQRLIREPVGGGYYQLRFAHSDKCLDVAAGSTHNGANVLQWQCNGGANQQWRFVSAAAGGYNLKAKHSGKCLDVKSNSSSDGANLRQYSCNGGDNQRFGWQR